jgi:hypothetical protein
MADDCCVVAVIAAHAAGGSAAAAAIALLWFTDGGSYAWVLVEVGGEQRHSGVWTNDRRGTYLVDAQNGRGFAGHKLAYLVAWRRQHQHYCHGRCHRRPAHQNLPHDVRCRIHCGCGCSAPWLPDVQVQKNCAAAVRARCPLQVHSVASNDVWSRVAAFGVRADETR